VHRKLLRSRGLPEWHLLLRSKQPVYASNTVERRNFLISRIPRVAELLTETDTKFFHLVYIKLLFQIKFAGTECGGTNLNYHVGLAATYLFVALVSFVQLIIAIVMSCRNQVDKGTCFREALSPTTPKAIYAVVFLAASVRAAYFAVSVSPNS